MSVMQKATITLMSNFFNRDWSNLTNHYDLPQMDEQTTAEPKEALCNSDEVATTETDHWVKEEQDENYQDSPGQSSNNEAENEVSGYDHDHAHEPEGENFKSSPTYSHADVDSSPVLFSSGIETMHSGLNPQANIDYYPLPFTQSNVMRDLNARKTVRTRAATMSTTRDFVARHNISLNHYPNPLPTLENLRYKYGNPAPASSEAFPDDIPSIDDLLDPLVSGVDMDTIFSSVEEASCSYSQQFHLPPDDTVPTTVEQKKAIVKALCNAMMNVEQAEDNPGMIKPFAERKYSDRRVELACWHLMVSFPVSNDIEQADERLSGGMYKSSCVWASLGSLRYQV